MNSIFKQYGRALITIIASISILGFIFGFGAGNVNVVKGIGNINESIDADTGKTSTDASADANAAIQSNIIATTLKDQITTSRGIRPFVPTQEKLNIEDFLNIPANAKVYVIKVTDSQFNELDKDGNSGSAKGATSITFPRRGSYNIRVKMISDNGTATGMVAVNAQDWVSIPYEVHFDGNGATSGSMPNLTMEYGSASNLPQNAFAKTGYSFKGWTLTRDGSGAIYSDKQEIKNLLSNTGTITFYAQWTINQYYLDLNIASPVSGGNISGYGTANVYIDGKLVANNCEDFCQLINFGSIYRIDVFGNGTYTIDGASTFTGVMGASNTSISPKFKLNAVQITINDYIADSNGNNISLYSSRKTANLLIGSSQTYQPISINGYSTPSAITKIVNPGLEVNYYHTQDISPSYVDTTTDEPGARYTHIEFYPYGDSNAMVYASVFDYSTVPTWTVGNGQDDLDWYGRNGGVEVTGNPAYPYSTCIGHGYTGFGPWVSANGANVQRSQHEAWSTDVYAAGGQCLQHISYIPQIWLNYYVDGQLVHQVPKWLSVAVSRGEEPIWNYNGSKQGWTFKGWYSAGNNGWNSVGYFKPGMHVSMTSWLRSSSWVNSFPDMRFDAVFQRNAWSSSN